MKNGEVQSKISSNGTSHRTLAAFARHRIAHQLLISEIIQQFVSEFSEMSPEAMGRRRLNLQQSTSLDFIGMAKTAESIGVNAKDFIQFCREVFLDAFDEAQRIHTESNPQQIPQEEPVPEQDPNTV